jgi:hypothetical protein
MARKSDSTHTHYNPSVPPLRFAQVDSQASCGEVGRCTGYPGLVTCPDCKPIAEADMARAKQAMNGGCTHGR